MRLINWLNLYEFNENEECVLKDIDKRYLVEIIHGVIFVNLREGSNLSNDPSLLERLLIEYYEYKNRDNRYRDRFDYTDLESKLARDERFKRKPYAMRISSKNTDNYENFNEVFKIYKLKNLYEEEQLLASGVDYESVHYIYRQYVKWNYIAGVGRNIYFDHRDFPDNVQYLGVEVIKGGAIGTKKYFKIVKDEI